MDISKIDSRLAEIKERIESLARQIDKLEEESEELDNARDTILQYIGSDAIEVVPAKRASAVDITRKQKIVFEAVPIGKEERLKPADIAKNCPRLSADYVRTTLRRLVDADTVYSEDGYYWFDL